MEQFGVGEKQGGIPAKQHQTGNQARVGIALGIVKALDPLRLPQHGGIRTPAIPQKFNDCDQDGQTNTFDCAKHRHADSADDRQPELPALYAIDASQVSDFDQANGRCDDHRSQGAVGQVAQQVGSQHQQQRNGQRADHTGHLGFRAGGFGHGRAR
ncbi:hypothetical protein D3C86_1436480 [compost metagenome]